MLSGIIFLSCLSTPSVPVGTTTAPSASVQNAPVDQAEAIAGDATPDINSEPPVETSISSEIPAGGDEVAIADSAVPDLPPAEKLLYFYPEPDVTVTPPTAPVPAPEKAVVPKQPAPAPVKPVTDAKAPAKVVAKTDEKVAAKNDEKTAAKTDEKAAAEILPGIWGTEPTAPAISPDKASAAPAVPRQPPSRQATIPAGQTLEVWYPGNGWVFLGDASAQNGLGYENRKLDKTDTLFTFKALKPGNYILDFSRFDVLDDSFLQDSLAVTVTEEGAVRTGKIRAPDYRALANTAPGAAPGVTPGAKNSPVSPLPPGALQAESAKSIQGTQSLSPGRTAQPVMTNEPSLAGPQGVPVASNTDIPTDPAEILKKATDSLASGDGVTALSLIDAFFTTAVTSLDEAWFIRGQAYESNGASRDIRKALEAYQTLVQAYPDSPRWKAADERIRYIRQFYQKIR